MRTIIAGSRNATGEDVSLALALCPFTDQISVVISGTASGADQEGEKWANRIGIPVERFPADWKAYGKSAGFIRNKQMTEEADADALIAVWDGESNGTKNMIDLAKKAGLEVFIHQFSRVKLWF